MSIIQIMVTIIIVTILVTVILGVASYAVFWLRRMRRPASRPQPDSDSPRFFYRYIPKADVAADASGTETEPDKDELSDLEALLEQTLVPAGVTNDGSS